MTFDLKSQCLKMVPEPERVVYEHDECLMRKHVKYQQVSQNDQVKHEMVQSITSPDRKLCVIPTADRNNSLSISCSGFLQMIDIMWKMNDEMIFEYFFLL